MTTIHDQRHQQIIALLRAIREDKNLTQEDLAKKLGQPQSWVSKVEIGERRLDVVELQDWVEQLGLTLVEFIAQLRWSQTINSSLPAIPERASARDVANGAEVTMAWQGKQIPIFLEDANAASLTKIEKSVSKLFAELNASPKGKKNRDVILEALQLALYELPDTNPSDLYHHIVYRLYLREYSRTQADQSWVRAGGEALELFVEKHYNSALAGKGIVLKALLNDAVREQALDEMGIRAAVGGSKLDIALYGDGPLGRKIFGGIHLKASLAERVSDDVPCSEQMMKKGYASLLLTLDAKSFPPPTGDLVNRGELGTTQAPSDKRNYIELHGSFSACFSYNLRTVPSPATTTSGRRIFVSSFAQGSDLLPNYLIQLWADFQKAHP